jgi:hypothetical protein
VDTSICISNTDLGIFGMPDTDLLILDLTTNVCILPLPRQVGAEIPMDSEDADDANRNDNGRTLLYVFERG